MTGVRASVLPADTKLVVDHNHFTVCNQGAVNHYIKRLTCNTV